MPADKTPTKAAPTTVAPWTTPQMSAELEQQIAETKMLLASRVIHTEEAREILTRQIRLVETLLYGAPKTEIKPRHHG